MNWINLAIYFIFLLWHSKFCIWYGWTISYES